MKHNFSIVWLLFIFVLLYFLKEPLLSLMIKQDYNLETKQIHFEEDYQNLKKEYEALFAFPYQDSNAIISKVFIRDPLLFFEEITILKGKEEHVLLGSAVVNERGLIGVVKKVNSHSSVVELLPNKNTKIAVKIGTINGLLESDDGELKIRNITNKEPLEVNSEIRTTNSGRFDADILVGTVKEIRTTNQNLSAEIIVTPAVDFEQLHYLYVKGSSNYE